MTQSGTQSITQNALLQKVWSSTYYRQSFVRYILKHHQVNSKQWDEISALIGALAQWYSDEAAIKKIINTVAQFPRKPSKRSSRARERAKICIKLINNKPADKSVAKLAAKPVDKSPRLSESTVQTTLRAEHSIRTYLDYGCGDGSITQRIGRQLGLEQSSIIGVDISTCKNPHITYLSNTADLADESVDLVTAFVSFHHIRNVEEIIREIARLLRPGGVFILREHDFTGKKIMKSYLDLIHLYIHYQKYETYKEEILAGIMYKSEYEWSCLLRKYGLLVEETYYYPGNNSQRLYYASYVKARAVEK